MIVKKHFLFLSFSLLLVSYFVRCVCDCHRRCLPSMPIHTKAHAIIIQLSSSCYFKNEIFITEIMIMRPCQDFVVIIYFVSSSSQPSSLYLMACKKPHRYFLSFSLVTATQRQHIIGRRLWWVRLHRWCLLFLFFLSLFIDVMKVK